MNWFLSHDLKNIGRKANPDRKFVVALEKQLKAKIGHPLWWVSGWKWGVGAATVVCFVGSTTGVYAFTSDSVLPMTPLYPVRIAIERVQEVVAVTPAKKAQVHAESMERRYRENALMAKKQQPVTQGMVMAFDHGLSEQLDENAHLPTSTRDLLDAKVAALKQEFEQNVFSTSTDAAEVSSSTEAVQRPELTELKKKIEQLDPTRKAKFELQKEEQDQKGQTDEHQTSAKGSQEQLQNRTSKDGVHQSQETND